jgi:uracil-DNA glycosylase
MTYLGEYMIIFPQDWNDVLAKEKQLPYFSLLFNRLQDEYMQQIVYPPQLALFHAMELTSFCDTKVVILGQDPYHRENQAHGLSFSVPIGMPFPPSLRNIFTELQNDLGCSLPEHGCLESWAKQGVLLLNTVMSVRQGEPGSHRELGWEYLTNAIIQEINRKKTPIVFILWGKDAITKMKWIDTDRHFIKSSVHPSPLSAYRGFFGSKPFSQANAWLKQTNQTEINWCI